MLEKNVLKVETPGDGCYPIHIESGSLDTVAVFCSRHAPAHRYCVIADSQVAQLYGERVLEAFRREDINVEIISFPAGEWNKSCEAWSSLSNKLISAGFGRDSAIVALGGGVTGDLAGFVAATYMRGVPVVQVPTSLLAMLDSSVGGKTGIDTDAGKNLIGAFHHPAGVLVDPVVLKTLPRDQRCAGLAEAIKTAAILDEDLWDWMGVHAHELVKGGTDASAQLVARVVSHKAHIVAEDPAEQNLRSILNFGHTVGHALEALEGYKLLHGEAVAAGMRIEACMGESLGITKLGTTKQIEALLEQCLLGGLWEVDRRSAEVREAMLLDKKSLKNRVRCVFLSQIGTVATDTEGHYTFPLDREELDDLLSTALTANPKD